jgi:protein-tyrosine-phosphatase
MNILFVCKYNRFRSRIAEAYFKKINKNPRLKAFSAGIIKGSYPLDKEEVKTAKKLGINIQGKPKSLEVGKLKKTDLIILVADNVPKSNFYTTFKNRIIHWKIKDVEYWDGKDLIHSKIKQIMKKVEKLLPMLEKKSFRKKLQIAKEKAEYEHRHSKRI